MCLMVPISVIGGILTTLGISGFTQEILLQTLHPAYLGSVMLGTILYLLGRWIIGSKKWVVIILAFGTTLLSYFSLCVFFLFTDVSVLGNVLSHHPAALTFLFLRPGIEEIVIYTLMVLAIFWLAEWIFLINFQKMWVINILIFPVSLLANNIISKLPDTSQLLLVLGLASSYIFTITLLVTLLTFLTDFFFLFFWEFSSRDKDLTIYLLPTSLLERGFLRKCAEIFTNEFDNMKRKTKNFLSENFIYLPALTMVILTIIAMFSLNYFPGRVIAASILARGANSLLHSGDYENAFRLGMASFQIEELNPTAHSVLGTIYFDRKDYTNTIRHLKYQIDYRPNYAGYHYLLGLVYLETGQIGMAKPELERSVQLKPNDLDSNTDLAIVYAKLAQRNEYFLSIKRIFELEANSQDKLEAFQKLFKNDPYHLLADVLKPGRPVGYGRQTTAAINSQNVLYLLSLSSSFPQAMVVSQSNDMGQTWKDQKLLYVGENLNGTLVVDSNGIIHIVFGEQGGPVLYTNSTSSFANILTVAPKGDGRQITVDLQGTIHVVWYDENKIYYSSIAQGRASPPVLVGEQGWSPDITCGENGEIIISYNSALAFPDPQGQVYLVRKPKDGDWQVPQKISMGTGWAGAASVVYGKSNQINLSYLQGQDNQHIQIKLLELDMLGNRVNEQLVSDETTVPYIPSDPRLQFSGRTAPAMGLDGNGNLLIAWRVLANSDILFRKLNGGVWSNPEKIGNLTGMLYDSSPSFIQKQSGSSELNVAVLWAVNDQPIIVPFGEK